VGYTFVADNMATGPFSFV